MSFIKAEDIGIQAVSHSRMKTHEGCPRKAKYKFIDKLKEPPNEAMERGLRIHKELETWLCSVVGLPWDKEYWNPKRGGIYDRIREHCAEDFWAKGSPKYAVKPEMQMAFDKEWQECSWFGPEAWMRVVFDVVGISPCGNQITLYDWKTGKVYDDHDDQADLYAVAGYYMGAASVTVKFFYLDQDIIQPYHYDRDELEELVKTIEARALKVTSDRVFATNPSWRCKYCHFRRENGGPCQH